MRVPRAGDGVAGGDVGAEGAAIGVGGDEEGDGGVDFVNGAGGLRDRVVDGEAD